MKKATTHRCIGFWVPPVIAATGLDQMISQVLHVPRVGHSHFCFKEMNNWKNKTKQENSICKLYCFIELLNTLKFQQRTDDCS